ncbi:IS3 family transposase [Streptomyces sp. NPDC102365]|uniref:IS3 family transposase n=1 Tax=Streptomyces sp. NPDC102365 TaxID=3366162 RepID=UPI003800156D
MASSGCAPSSGSPARASTTGVGPRPGPCGPARQAADAQLAARIRAVHQASDGTYGVPRITAELRENSERVNHKRLCPGGGAADGRGVSRRKPRRLPAVLR